VAGQRASGAGRRLSIGGSRRCGGSGATLHGKAIFVLYCLGCENSMPNHRIIMAYETADLRLAKAAELAGGPFSCERVIYYAVKPEK
jgi:hypothetical protein